MPEKCKNRGAGSLEGENVIYSRKMVLKNALVEKAM
jgi:hypothetical protein